MNSNEFENINNKPENTKAEADGDNKIFENLEKGKEEDKTLDKEKTENNESQGEDFKKQTQTDEQKAENTDKKCENGDIGNNKKYASNYTPPYYVPNFTVVNSDDLNDEQIENKSKRKEKKKYGIGVIAIICSICLLISVTVGAIAGAIAGGGIIFNIPQKGDELVNIVRSDREITVNEIPGNTGYSDLTVAQVAALVGNSVVEITTKHVQTNSFYGQYITSGAGSGVIFDQQGNSAYIVTNFHVIEGADDITVRVKNSTSYSDYTAEYIAGDKAGDLAVVKINGSGETFSTVVFGNSDKLIVGEEVVAIGNPLGSLGGTVTNGIISALDREITVEDNVMTLLQTNAAINPGNSGGGLFNMAGELVGIVNAKQSSTGIEGLGFAIPANKVVSDITDILELGYVSGRSTLGITVQEGSYKGQSGVFVTDVGSSSFSKFDRIAQIGDYTITTMSDYNAALKKLAIGSNVTVKVAREGKWEFVSVNVTVSENKNKY